MGVIGHAIYRNQFLPFSCDNSGNVLLQLLATVLGNHTNAAIHREHNMQIDLRVGVGHLAKTLHGAPSGAYHRGFFEALQTCRTYGASYCDFVDPFWEGNKAPLGAQCL